MSAEKPCLLPFERGERDIKVRKAAESDAKYGCEPDKRNVEELLDFGVVNINKPKGPTSHQVSAYVQKILGIKKSGHSGTLDPKVTGVLPVALGRGTRIVQTLLPAGKEYVCILHLHEDLPEEKVREAVMSFVGKIKQLPPVRSAIKRRERIRKIYYIEIIEIDGKDVLFRVGCQAGTYIRKLCHDIGKKLGCGGHMAELIRTKAGPFNDNGSITLQDLADAYHYYKEEGNDKYIRKCIQPLESAVEHLPKIYVFDTTVDSMTHGADLKAPGISAVETDIQVGEMCAIMTLKGELVAIGRTEMITKEMLKKDRGVAARTDKVFMKEGVYPKVQPPKKGIENDEGNK